MVTHYDLRIKSQTAIRPILERDGFINPQDVARAFGVSIQAAGIRLKTLKLLTPQNQDQWFGDA